MGIGTVIAIVMAIAVIAFIIRKTSGSKSSGGSGGDRPGDDQPPRYDQR